MLSRLRPSGREDACLPGRTTFLSCPGEVLVEVARENPVHCVSSVEAFLVVSLADGQDFLSVYAA